MAEEENEFATLMEQLRAGDEEAGWTLIETYGPHILRVVRRDLNHRLRSKYDSSDFVQSVWASFFRQPGQFRQLRSPDELLALLATVARNKVIDETRRRMYTLKRDIIREEPLEVLAPHVLEEVHSTLPRPSQVAVAREQWKLLLKGQPRRVRRILEMRFAGSTYEEIAIELKLHERYVRKIVDELLVRLEEG